MTENGSRLLTSADSTPIWASSAGDPAKPAVVFIHSLSTNSLVWEAQFTDPELLKNLFLVRFDMRGHGRSGMPGDPAAYESARFAEDFKTVCDAHGLDKPFVVAWSAGAAMIPDIIGAYGPVISGVVYVGGPILSFGLLAECLHPHIMSLAERMVSPDLGEVYATAAPFVDSCFSDPSTVPYALKLQLVGGYVMQSPKARVNTLLRQQDETRWRKEGRQIPLLIMTGKKDLHNLHEKMIPVAKAIYENVDVKLFEEAGHALHMEHPHEVDRYILEFVRRVTAH